LKGIEDERIASAEGFEQGELGRTQQAHTSMVFHDIEMYHTYARRATNGCMFWAAGTSHPTALS
jgi:hypothetical protein